MTIDVKNDEMLGKTDSVYAIKFYAMQKQIDDLQQENQQLNEDIKVLFKENSNKEEVINRYEDNWDKLKVFMRYENINRLFEQGYETKDFISEIQNKIEELEKGVSDDKD